MALYSALLPSQLSVQESNTFIINNYTEKESHRDFSKDIQYLRILTKAVQLYFISNLSIFDITKNQSNNSIGGVSGNNNSFYFTPIKNQSYSTIDSSPSSNPSSISFKSLNQTTSLPTSVTKPSSISSSR
ncbi:hypothetical protein ACTA71_001106 [Dictyostelium dimigraforme]